MKLLIIGGSYFVGKCFVSLASPSNELTLLNRGNNPLNIEGIKELHLDRRDAEALSKLDHCEYDAVIDFCAYQKGDIKLIFDHLNGSFKQYIFISTVDVYRHGTGILLDEEGPFEDRNFGGEAGNYILGKVALEGELRECCRERDIAFTSLRPSFIYGPGNYAPREGIYFNWIEKAGQIIHPSDSDGSFQMIYVRDMAEAILKVCGLGAAYNEAFNLCPMDLITYDDFADALEKALGKGFERVLLSVEEINTGGIPLPFPLTKQESNFYSSKKASEILKLSYTSLADGLREEISS